MTGRRPPLDCADRWTVVSLVIGVVLVWWRDDYRPVALAVALALLGELTRHRPPSRR